MSTRAERLLEAEPKSDLRYSARVRPARILEAVAREYGCTIADLQGPARVARICEARHLACTLLYDLSRMSNVDVGDMMGLDHSTVIYARQRIAGQMRRSDFAEAVRVIIENLVGPGEDLVEDGRQEWARHPRWHAWTKAEGRNAVERTTQTEDSELHLLIDCNGYLFVAELGDEVTLPFGHPEAALLVADMIVARAGTP